MVGKNHTEHAAASLADVEQHCKDQSHESHAAARDSALFYVVNNADDFVFSQQKTKPRRWLKNQGGNKVVGKNHKQRIKRRPP